MLASKIRNVLGTLVAAWMYFTRVPLPKKLHNLTNGTQRSLEQSVCLLSLFGAVIGLFGATVFWGAEYLFESKSLAVLLSMVSTILVTGALHEDGLGDFFDGFGGGWWDKKRILEIMKDSRTGTFGILAIVLALFLKFEALMAIPGSLIPATLVAAHAFSRFAAGSFFFTDHYVRANDESHFKPMAKGRMSKRDVLILGAGGVLPVFLLGDWRYLLLLPLLWLVRLWFGRWFVRKIGGYTGDCLGATQQILELCFYLGVIAFGNLL